MSLYPTPTRVALLMDVADGLVINSDTNGPVLRENGQARRVTGRVNELIRAGWVEFMDGQYQLTAAGQDILADGVR
jgi:hypothetical protein